MAGPLAFAVGAGALAGSAVAAFQERERRQNVYTARARDANAVQLLANPARLRQLHARTDGISWDEDQPVWLLLVHVKEAKVGSRLKGARCQVDVKYGAQGCSLKRETDPVQAKIDADGSCVAHFNQTLMFLWRRNIAPHIRIKLSKRGRLTRMIGKTEFTFKFTGTPGHHDKELTLDGAERPTLRIIAEMRAISLGELRVHGFNIGKVVSQPRLADPRSMPPLLKGIAVSAAPDVQPLTQAQSRNGSIVEGRVISGANSVSPMTGRSYNASLGSPLTTQVFGGLPAMAAFGDSTRLPAPQNAADTLFSEVPSADSRSDIGTDASAEEGSLSSQSEEDGGHRRRWTICS